MKRIGVLTACALALSIPATATDWWRVSTQVFPNVEQMNTSTKIVLNVKLGTTYAMVARIDPVNPPCKCDHLELVPPAGKEARWMNLILTAVTMGRELHVYGVCDTVAKTLTADALYANGRISLSE